MPTVVLFDEPFSLDSFIIVVSIEGGIFFIELETQFRLPSVL